MIEKEVAGIARFVLEHVEFSAVYYHNIPESFAVPSVFFPSPEIEILPDTLNTYSTDYTIFVKFFHSSTERAYELALPVVYAISSARKLIPLFDISGKKTKKFVRVKNIQLKKADECAYQLQIDWTSRRSFTRSEGELVRSFYLNGGKL